MPGGPCGAFFIFTRMQRPCVLRGCRRDLYLPVTICVFLHRGSGCRPRPEDEGVGGLSWKPVCGVSHRHHGSGGEPLTVLTIISQKSNTPLDDVLKMKKDGMDIKQIAEKLNVKREDIL